MTIANSKVTCIKNNRKPFSLNPYNRRLKQSSYLKQKKTISHKIVGIEYDNKLSFYKQIKALNGAIDRKIRSLQMLKNLNVKSKTLLYGSYLKSIIEYSYPIYPYLSHTNKQRYQSLQNKGIYNFILSPLDLKQRPRALGAHIQLKLKSMAQVSYERYKKLFDIMEINSPYWHKELANHTLAKLYGSKNSSIKLTPMQFARGPRPQYHYSNKQTTA